MVSFPDASDSRVVENFVMKKSDEVNGALKALEGIGNNCEFGIVQRYFGYDPPGLFRNVGFYSVKIII
jgi:hypothetical protein